MPQAPPSTTSQAGSTLMFQVYARSPTDATNVLIAAIQKVGTDPAKIIDATGKGNPSDGVTGRRVLTTKGDIRTRCDRVQVRRQMGNR